MKKSIMGLLMITLFLMADETNKSVWPLACELFEAVKFSEHKFVNVASTPYGEWYFEEKTIKIDRKNKKIEVWTFNLPTIEARKHMIEALGEYDDFANYGYFTQLYIIDYANMKLKSNTIIRDCEGNIILQHDMPDKFSYPNSMQQSLAEIIIKKYKLR
ncbi:MAG: hypothetical protein PHE73_01160 [Sulfurovaceae bacterium]|nr:hypothetical protein [Sulfurovaceae bacterium]